MTDRTSLLTSPPSSLWASDPRQPLAGRASLAGEVSEEESDEQACMAFGYLRGLRERSLSLEFRFKCGDREWFPYTMLAGCRYDPSVGILMKFTGDVVTLVLIRGSNLDLPVHQGAVDLIERGLERHRVLWIREMSEDELGKAGEKEPTVDRIVIAELESQEELRLWLESTAPAFVRR